MNINTMTADEVIGLIPDSVLDQISSDTKADYGVKKLNGKVVFKLFLYTALSAKRISLRIMAAVYASDKFKHLFSLPDGSTRHSSLGIRLNSIKSDYFKKILQHLIDHPRVDAICFAGKKIVLSKLDSTFLTISEKLISYGMSINKGQKNLKFAVELSESIPVNFLLCTDQSEISDNGTFPEVLKARSQKKALNIAIFDRGGESKRQYIELTRQGIFFITRLSKLKPQPTEDLPLTETDTKTLQLLADKKIILTDPNTKQSETFRVVSGKSKQTGEIISFITNIDFLSAAEITILYKSRWEIETFFKFIKQELNFSHLLSRSRNGATNVTYLTMITAILLTIYKKVNKVVGWVVTKIKFLDELERWLKEEWEKPILLEFLRKNPQLVAELKE